MNIVAAAKAAWTTLFAGGTTAKAAIGPAGAPAAPAPAQPPPGPPATNPYQAGNDQIRKTATWLIGALAAVAAILLAGSQVSSIGKLPADHITGRLTVAGVAAVVAIGSVMFAIYRLSLILAPVTTPLKDLRKEAETPSSKMVEIMKSDTGLTAGYPDIHDLLAKYDTERAKRIDARKRHQAARDKLAAAVSDAEKAAAMKAEETADLAEQRADTDVAGLRRYVVGLTQLLGFLTVSRRFETERSRVVVAAVVGAVAIVTFAWAANPATPSADAAAALPAKPVSVTVFLTPAGVQELSSVLGASCAKEAAATGTPGIALSASTEAAEVVLTGGGSCTGPQRITLESRLAHLVVADATAIA
ncbi:MAG TPA: hypothetical protein VIM10_00240 [Actinopolymorphaceae bacterium]